MRPIHWVIVCEYWTLVFCSSPSLWELFFFAGAITFSMSAGWKKTTKMGKWENKSFFHFFAKSSICFVPNYVHLHLQKVTSSTLPYVSFSMWLYDVIKRCKICAFFCFFVKKNMSKQPNSFWGWLNRVHVRSELPGK